jgi:hypothetical protein
MMIRSSCLPKAAAIASLFLLAPAFLAVGAPAAPARAEDLRALIGGIAVISADKPEGTSLSIGYDEALAVLMPKDSPFIQGFELEIRLPKAAIAVPGGFAYELWQGLSPEPDRKKLAYRGERIIMQGLPARAGYAIQIPTRGDHSLKSGPYATVIPAIVGQGDFPFLFKLIPVSKGLPPAVESAKFQVRVRPLLADAGVLSLKLRYPEEAGAPEGERFPVDVSVDDQKVDPSAPLTLKAGSHKLVVSSEAYRDESRGFAIEPGKTLELVVELQDTRPLVVFEAPDSAVVSIDGARIDHVAHPALSVEPGEHSATCRLGDYTLTRRFVAYRGKSYRLVLSVDFQVEEEEP